MKPASDHKAKGRSILAVAVTAGALCVGIVIAARADDGEQHTPFHANRLGLQAVHSVQRLPDPRVRCEPGPHRHSSCQP